MITDEQWELAVITGRCPVCRYDVLGTTPHSDGCPVGESTKRSLHDEAQARAIANHDEELAGLQSLAGRL